MTYLRRTTEAELHSDLEQQGRMVGTQRQPNWGSSQDLTSNGVGVRAWKQVVLIQAPKARNWAIVASVDVPGNVLARVRWGNGGVQYEVILSILNGFTINVPGSFVSVDVCLDAVLGQKARASIFASENNAGRPPGYFIQNVGGVLPGAQIQVNLPLFSRAVKVIPVTPDPGGVAFSVSETSWVLNYQANEKMVFEPLTGLVIFVINNDGVNTVNYCVIAELSL